MIVWLQYLPIDDWECVSPCPCWFPPWCWQHGLPLLHLDKTSWPPDVGHWHPSLKMSSLYAMWWPTCEELLWCSDTYFLTLPSISPIQVVDTAILVDIDNRQGSMFSTATGIHQLDAMYLLGSKIWSLGFCLVCLGEVVHPINASCSTTYISHAFPIKEGMVAYLL